MSNLELEIRSYIIIFGMAFLISFLSGCGNTMSGFKTDINEKRQSMADFLSPAERWVPISSFEKVKEKESK